ncbi:hypothetical protein ACQKWADRAFT_300829 [Trichoderma austrokoningii]
MSQKINSKNLSYSSSLPPFLAALHAQASGATGPDPILSSQRRGGKKRSSSEEAEDAPLILDEEGNTVDDVKVNKDGTVEELPNGSSSGGTEDRDAETSQNKTKNEPEAAKASIGGRKRKVGKVIGEEAENSALETAVAGKKREAVKESKDAEQQAANRKPKKKAKKIKLSFDEEEG